MRFGGGGAADVDRVWRRRGVYQALAEAIARIAKESLLNPPRSPSSRPVASVANLQLLSEGKVQLALAQNDIAYYAAEGSTLRRSAERRRPISARSCRSIEYIHVVASQASGVLVGGGVPWQAGRAGPVGSGTEQNALQVLEAHGLKTTDLACRRSASTRPTR